VCMGFEARWQQRASFCPEAGRQPLSQQPNDS